METQPKDPSPVRYGGIAIILGILSIYMMAWFSSRMGGQQEAQQHPQKMSTILHSFGAKVAPTTSPVPFEAAGNFAGHWIVKIWTVNEDGSMKDEQLAFVYGVQPPYREQQMRCEIIRVDWSVWRPNRVMTICAPL